MKKESYYNKKIYSKVAILTAIHEYKEICKICFNDDIDNYKLLFNADEEDTDIIIYEFNNFLIALEEKYGKYNY